MKPRTSEGLHRSSRNHEAPNWILIAWGAVLSMLSVRLGYKLKEANGAKEVDKSTQSSRGVYCILTNSTYYVSFLCYLNVDRTCRCQM